MSGVDVARDTVVAKRCIDIVWWVIWLGSARDVRSVSPPRLSPNPPPAKDAPLTLKVDCLFQGDSFPSLMAHITRRHPAATPDDFVPGLIHHRPLGLPRSLLGLPTLPHHARIHDIDTTDGVAQPFPGEPGVRAKRLVVRGCLSGRRPKKEDYEEKQRAMMAISTVIAGAQRMAPIVSGTSLDADKAVDKPAKEIDRPGHEEHLPAWSARTTQGENELVNGGGNAVVAKEGVKSEKGDRRVAEQGPPAPPKARRGLLIRIPSTILGGGQSTSPGPTSSTSTTGETTWPKPKRRKVENPTVSAAWGVSDKVKRSERLRRKLHASVSSSSSLADSPI